MAGSLFIVATPIGNLEDITFRAVETLKNVDVILCEDTRVTKNLLDRYEIKKEVLSYHHHSDARKINDIKNLLADGKNLALVTDAGTPGISDPGNQLISEILKIKACEIKIVGIPGASAVITALSISGFPTDRFTFFGFPPHKNKRQKYFNEVSATEHTVVFFESGHRILKCLDELKVVLDQKRKVVICRELTKMFETIYRGNIEQICDMKIDERGEFVIVIAPL